MYGRTRVKRLTVENEGTGVYIARRIERNSEDVEMVLVRKFPVQLSKKG
jgi:hypothetical protein